MQRIFGEFTVEGFKTLVMDPKVTIDSWKITRDLERKRTLVYAIYTKREIWEDM